MIVRRSRALGFAFLIPFSAVALHADVTLRYTMDFKMNPAIAQLTASAMKGMQSALPMESSIRLKNAKGFYGSSAYTSIVDFTTKEVTLLDSAGKSYAKVTPDGLAEALAGAMPKIPAEANAIMASMKATVTPSRLTGRTEAIQGVQAEEHEIVIAVSGPALPNTPAAPMIRMVMQVWSAAPGEVLRVPAIRELTGYSLFAYANMNPLGGMDQIMKQMPGFGDVAGPIMTEMQKVGTILRVHMDMFMPMLAAMMQQVPAAGAAFGAGFDPNAPLMQMNQEAVELSTAPVPDSVFQIPEGYREATATEVFKGMVAKSQPVPAK
jgi:hypothetical protein